MVALRRSRSAGWVRLAVALSWLGVPARAPPGAARVIAIEPASALTVIDNARRHIRIDLATRLAFVVSLWRVDMPRASWRGFLRLSLVACPIYLSPATTRTKSIRLHQVWQPTSADEADEVPDRVERKMFQIGSQVLPR